MTGWRLGWISAPRRWGEALLKTHQALVSGVAGFVQQDVYKRQVENILMNPFLTVF